MPKLLFFRFAAHRGLGFTLSTQYYCSVFSAICRPSDHTLRGGPGPRFEPRTGDLLYVQGWDSNHSNQTVNCTHQRFIYSNNTQHNWVENFKKTAQNRVEYSNKMVHNRVKNFNKIAHNRVEYFKKRHTTGLNIPIIRHTTRVEYSHKTAHNRDKYSNKTAHNKFQ